MAFSCFLHNNWFSEPLSLFKTSNQISLWPHNSNAGSWHPVQYLL